MHPTCLLKLKYTPGKYYTCLNCYPFHFIDHLALPPTSLYLHFTTTHHFTTPYFPIPFTLTPTLLFHPFQCSLSFFNPHFTLPFHSITHFTSHPLYLTTQSTTQITATGSTLPPPLPPLHLPLNHRLLSYHLIHCSESADNSIFPTKMFWIKIQNESQYAGYFIISFFYTFDMFLVTLLQV